jgi:hypothetical protein
MLPFGFWVEVWVWARGRVSSGSAVGFRLECPSSSSQTFLLRKGISRHSVTFSWWHRACHKCLTLHKHEVLARFCTSSMGCFTSVKSWPDDLPQVQKPQINPRAVRTSFKDPIDTSRWAPPWQTWHTILEPQHFQVRFQAKPLHNHVLCPKRAFLASSVWRRLAAETVA